MSFSNNRLLSPSQVLPGALPGGTSDENSPTTESQTENFFEPDARKATLASGGFGRALKDEDRWMVASTVIGGDTVEVGLVADGHGGSAAASHCKRHAVPYLFERANGDASAESLRRAGRAAFDRLHAEVRDTGLTDGTVLTLCIINLTRSEVTTLHAGDCTAVLIPHQAGSSLKAQRLTAEHRLEESKFERKRVAELGGTVARLQHPVTKEPGGPLRVFPGGLALARGIGDLDAGNVISCVPATSTLGLSAFGCGGWDIVVASDGVWDSLSYGAVFKACRQSLSAPPARTAELIVDYAVKSRHAFDNTGAKVPRDDTTCVVLRYRSLDEMAVSCVKKGCEDIGVVEPTVKDDFVQDEVYATDVTDDAVAPKVV